MKNTLTFALARLSCHLRISYGAI